MIKVKFDGCDGHDSKTFSNFKDLSVWLAYKFRESEMFLDREFEIVDIEQTED